MAAPRVLAIVLAGGEGKRLMPLTADRAKPAVPFGGIYRLVDFALSNVVNAGYLRVVVLTQYKSHSLDRHITKTWRMSPLLGNYVAPVPAQQRVGKNWFLGSADAIFQSLNILDDERPDIVVVVGADHVYRMDFSQMVAAHVDSGAEMTVAGIRQPIGLADQFGVISASADDPTRIAAFLEKPQHPQGLSDSPDEVLASMGNYVMNADAMLDAVTKDSKNSAPSTTWAATSCPTSSTRGRPGCTTSSTTTCPGPRTATVTTGATSGRSTPTTTPTWTSSPSSPCSTSTTTPGRCTPGTWVCRPRSSCTPPVTASGRHRLDHLPRGRRLGWRGQRLRALPGVRVNSWADVDGSVLMDGVVVHRHAQVHKAILDKFVVVEDGASVGVDAELDRSRGFAVTPAGVTVVPKGTRISKA